MQDKELFYVGIESPIDFRRNILESSKKILTTLQLYEEIKKLRVEKYSNVVQIKKIVDELRILMDNLNKSFPQTVIRPSKKAPRLVQVPKTEEQKPKAQQISEPKKIIKAGPIRDTDELKKLEDDLKEIETKLSTFKI